jgi:hypothetical protein
MKNSALSRIAVDSNICGGLAQAKPKYSPAMII